MMVDCRRLSWVIPSVEIVWVVAAFGRSAVVALLVQSSSMGYCSTSRQLRTAVDVPSIGTLHMIVDKPGQFREPDMPSY